MFGAIEFGPNGTEDRCGESHRNSDERHCNVDNPHALPQCQQQATDSQWEMIYPHQPDRPEAIDERSCGQLRSNGRDGQKDKPTSKTAFWPGLDSDQMFMVKEDCGADERGRENRRAG